MSRSKLRQKKRPRAEKDNIGHLDITRQKKTGRTHSALHNGGNLDNQQILIEYKTQIPKRGNGPGDPSSSQTRGKRDGKDLIKNTEKKDRETKETRSDGRKKRTRKKRRAGSNLKKGESRWSSQEHLNTHRRINKNKQEGKGTSAKGRGGH